MVLISTTRNFIKASGLFFILKKVTVFRFSHFNPDTSKPVSVSLFFDHNFLLNSKRKQLLEEIQLQPSSSC